MPELRRLAADLINRPVVGTPNIDAVQARAARYRQRRATQLSAAAVALMLVLGLVGVGLVDGDGAGSSRLRAADGGDLPVDPSTVTLPTVPGGLPGATTTTTAGSPASTTTSTTSTTVGQPGPSPTPDPCPGGQNAGATDVGVTATQVTVSVSQETMSYVSGYVNRINSEGGVCGRRIVLVTQGEEFVHIPSLTTSGDRDTVVPVIGGDGAVKGQYESAWTWQIGSTTAAQARMMVKDAWDQGARTFAIVYEKDVRFGTEAEAAYRAYVGQLGGTVVTSVGVAPNQGSYASNVNAFNDVCSDGKCDEVALFLQPYAARGWMAEDPIGGRMFTDAGHMLVSSRFARDCGQPCEGLRLWSPWSLPVGERNADMSQYVTDVKAANPGTEVDDAQGVRSWLAARLLVDSLRATGANLTRARLQSSLNSLTFSTGLAPPMRWSTKRYANISARPYAVRTAAGAFSGFSYDGTFRHDPRP